ncbi:unnamed protein product [Pedinophyceae sp. YPF-701]|nr:unnamed protein product [Pedinophyceae sp. YPF-701]
MHRSTMMLAAAAAAVAGLTGAFATPEQPLAGFIRAQGTHFVNKDCASIYLSGWNGWKVMEEGARDPDLLARRLDAAVDAGFNTLRFFAHGSDPDMVLQTGPGEYNEEAFRGLDRAIAMAGERGLKLILSISNQWKAADFASKKQLVSYAAELGLAPGVQCDVDACTNGGYQGGDDDEFACYERACPNEDDAFWTNTAIRRMYKDHVRAVLARVNTVNSKRYSSDPTILAWNVMNEPVCRRGTRNGGDGTGCADDVDAFVADISALMKDLAPLQMVTVGQEGYYGPRETAQRRAVNPMPPQEGGADPLWAEKSGQSWIRNHGHDSIDFYGIHLWVDNWKVPQLEFQQAWIDQHVADATATGKPMIVEEFGKVADRTSPGDVERSRDPFFRGVYDAFKASVNSGAALRGALFWEWEDDATQGAGSERGVRRSDSTWYMIAENAALVRNLNGQQRGVGSCVPGREISYRSTDAAGRSWLSLGDGMVAKNVQPLAGGEGAGSDRASCAAACAEGCAGFTFGGNGCALIGEVRSGEQHSWGYRSGEQTFWKLTERNVAALGAKVAARGGSEAPPVAASSRN